MSIADGNSIEYKPLTSSHVLMVYLELSARITLYRAHPVSELINRNYMCIT